jgi:hypothetical protein
MAGKMERLPLERRRELFVALVAAQDEGLSVPVSRETIAQRFGVGVEMVRKVEDEGLEKNWPPFGRK